MVTTIGQADPLAPPFSMQIDTCSNTTLAPAASCTMTVRYAPTSQGDFADSFDIPSNAQTLTVHLHSGIKPFPWPMFVPAQ